MFDNSVSPKQLLKALQTLESATKNSSPKTLHNGIKRLREKVQSYDGSSFDELVLFVASPPKRARRKSTSSASKRDTSEALVREITSALEDAESNEAAFRKILDGYSKTCTAKAIRDSAAAYAASSIPRTKSAALDLIIGERSNRLRTKRKMDESGKATPW
ncbi:MAG: hypothetical protein AAF583_07340 [Pseudomonadota bacterium]